MHEGAESRHADCPEARQPEQLSALAVSRAVLRVVDCLIFLQIPPCPANYYYHGFRDYEQLVLVEN